MRQEFPENDRVSIAVDASGVAQVNLNRGDKLNAIDAEMVDALIHAGEALYDMAHLRCVVISGNGAGFCSGLDLSAFEELTGEDNLPLSDRTHGNSNRFQQLAMQWRKLPVPVIAAIHGVCLGGGLQIAGGADIRVVAPDARLAVMEVKWGLIPDMGGFALWRGLVRDDSLRALTYTNREFSGEEALHLGFATILDSSPVTRATGLARDIASRSPSAIRAAKALFNRQHDLGLDEILLEESLAQQRLLGSRNQLEAVHSQLERRAPDFTDP